MRVTSQVEDRVAPLLVLTVVLVLQLEGVQLEGVMEVEIEMMAKVKGLGTRLIFFKNPMTIVRSRTQEPRARVATVTNQIEARVAPLGLQVVEHLIKQRVIRQGKNRKGTKVTRVIVA